MSRERKGCDEKHSLEHLTLHDRKNPFCEFCQRGHMLKRYCKRIRAEDEDDEKLIHRATAFGDIIEADHMFPSQDARGLSEEQSALVVRDRYSGLVIVYPQSERTLDANHESLRHFAGKRLTGKKGVVFISDHARELTGAANKLGWISDPSVPGFWPHNANCEREVRSLKELARPAHVAAGFQKKLWPLSVDFTAKARSFFGLSPVLRHERGRKTRYEIATGQIFDGPKFPGSFGVLQGKGRWTF